MNKLVFLGLVPIFLLLVPNVYASGLGRSDFEEHPEAYCMGFGNNPGNKYLCANVDICDEEGEIKPDHQFCTGEAVTHPCPEGFHMVEDDESGLCYDNDLGCEYNGLIFNEEKTSCVEYKIDCDLNEDHPLCNGEERTDGIKVCDQPDHPGYKYCNGED